MDGMYPKTYYPTPGWRWFLLALAVSFGGASLCGVWYFVSAAELAGWDRAILIGLFLLFAGLAVYLVLSTLRSRIVLFPDRIEIHELTVTHSLCREEIAGWRLRAATPSIFILERKEPPGKTISTSWIYKADAALEQWFEGIDNLDVIAMQSGLERILQDETLGADETERFQRLQTARSSLCYCWLLSFPPSSPCAPAA